MKAFTSVLMCLVLLQPAAAESLRQPYEAEHADIARLIHELDYLANEARKLEQKHRSEPELLEFNYARLIHILEQESREIRDFINLKYQAPDVSGFRRSLAGENN
ncbi:MAG TPA: hypothetical protein EYP41_03465 [Anaerolineae bacterium]|nr:hypothetical protein [Anaerolineae bacterium]